MFISHLCVCVCVFLFVHISFDFRVPLADALSQIGIIFGSTFPALFAARTELLQRLRKNIRKKLAETSQRTSKKFTRNAKNLQRTSNKIIQRTFPKAKSQAAYSILRRDSNRNKPPAIKQGAAVLALAHSDIVIPSGVPPTHFHNTKF